MFKKPEIESKKFKELCKLAGFEKNSEIDTLALSKFYGVTEKTIKRWLFHQIPSEPMLKMLKLKVLNVKQENWINQFSDNYKKYEYIELLINNLTEKKIKIVLGYSDIKKTTLKLIINLLIKAYSALDK